MPSSEDQKAEKPSASSRLSVSPETFSLLVKLTPVFSVLGGLAVSFLLLFFLGYNPFAFFLLVLQGGLTNPLRIANTLVQTTPLLFSGLAILVSFKSSNYNLGGPGQAFIGGITGTGVSVILAQISPFWPLNALISIIAAFLAGGFLAWISAALKTKYNVNVVVSSVMISYIAINFSFYVLEHVFHDPADYAPWGWHLPVQAQIPRFFGYLHFGIFVALFCVLIVYVLFSKLTLGYHIQATGLNEKAAACAGINTRQATWVALFISGGFYAVAGCVEVLGVDHRMRNDWSSEFAFTGIPIALLGNLNPLGTLFAALFFGAFFQGTRIAQLGTGVPPAILGVIQALILIFTLVGGYVRHRMTQARI